MKFFFYPAFFCLLSIVGCLPTQNIAQNTPAFNGKNIQFTWKPTVYQTDFYLEPFSSYSGISFAISSVSDSRINKVTIGTITDITTKQTDTIATKQNISKWITNNLPNALNFLGINTPNNASITLECELKSFLVYDVQTIHAEFELGITAKKDNDMLIWEGSIKGDSELYLKPADSDGLSECISNALISTAYKILNETSFRDAVVKSMQ